MRAKIYITATFVLITGLVLAIANEYRERSLSEYKTIRTNKISSESQEAFKKMMDVLTHERCLNCHPSDNIPKQGEEGHPHYFGMARGTDNMGFQATNCNTCHQTENNDYSGVPGAPHWSLAPASMGWQGLSRIEIAKKLLNKETNGGKTHEQLIEHMTEDKLVLWAWNPGIDASGNPRELPPVSKEAFKAAVELWFENGAVIPSE